MNLKLEFPEIKHKKSYEKLIKEWGENEEIPTSPSRLFNHESFDDFLGKVIQDKTNCEYGVNSHLFFLIMDKNIVGAIQVRHHINHPNLFETGGHVGYGVAPKYRRKGYATKMLELGLNEAKKLGIEKLLITCDIDNFGSNKVIKKNGGIFERIAENGNTNRYWINLYIKQTNGPII